MRSLVVLLCAVAATSAAPQFLLQPQVLVQPPNTPAVVLDAHGRPLDTAEVASARALHYQAKLLEGHVLKKRSIGHVAVSEPVWAEQTLYAAPVASAVSHQSRVDVRSSPAVIATAPVVEARAVVAEPVYAARALVAGPTNYVGGSAVSHQSRVDVRSSPAIIESAPAVVETAGVVAEPVYARAVVAGPTTYVGGSAVSHQSRVDVQSSPAIVTEQVVSPVVEARAVVPSVVSEPVYAHAIHAAPSVYSGGSAVSHQSRVDIESSPAVVSHQVVAPAVLEARSAWSPASYW